MGFSTSEYWSGLPCSPPRDLLDLGIEPTSLFLHMAFSFNSQRTFLLPLSSLKDYKQMKVDAILVLFSEYLQHL